MHLSLAGPVLVWLSGLLVGAGVFWGKGKHILILGALIFLAVMCLVFAWSGRSVTTNVPRVHVNPSSSAGRLRYTDPDIRIREGIFMAKLHARPSNQYRYEHYDPR